MAEGIEPNFHEIAEERKALRNTAKELRYKGAVFEKHYKKPLKDLDDQASSFKITNFFEKDKRELLTKSELMGRAKSELRKQKARYDERRTYDERRILEENMYMDYESLSASSPEVIPVKTMFDEISELKDFQMKRMFEIMDPHTSLAVRKTSEAVLNTVREEITKKQEELRSVDPTALCEAELVKYKEELGRVGHLCITPNTQKYLEAIGERMLTGKPIFLHGPTGTGKTSLARFAAYHFTGKNPEMVYCNPQTKETNVWGKPGIEPVGDKGAIRTVDIYGPLARAMRDGKVVIFDEFTALPKEQMVFIKAVFGHKVGDEVPVVGNGTVKIASGFQMVFTANLKSEKNPERQELPPEITREFEQNNLEVKYNTPEEAYDIIRARLLNKDGSMDMSFYDLRVTLPNLCRVMAEIQESYVNETNKDVAKNAGAEDASGKVHSLKKFVMTQGSVEAILSAWNIERQMGNKKRSFAEFLDERFKTALTFKEYSKEDRILAAKILAAKGFLLTLSAKELDLPADVFDFNVAKVMREKNAIKDLREQSGDVKHLSLKEIADIDPFGKKTEILRKRAGKFLGQEGDEGGEEEKGEENDFIKGIRDRLKNLENLDNINAVFEPFLRETYKLWNVKADKIKNADIKPEIVDPTTVNYEAKSKDNEPKEFGKYTVNPDTQNLDWEALKNKIFIPDLSGFVDKPVHEVIQYVVDNFSTKYRFPGIEYWKFMIENPDKVPTTKKANLKDGNYYFSPGSLVRGSDGDWCVPFASWSGSSWSRDAHWLGNSWDADYRIVLLEI